jgi:hypothetical protein
MSYRNPKISQQDPLAFTKGFQAAFGQTMSAFKQVTDEIKKQKEKDDLLQAELLQRYLQEVADIKTGLGLLTKFMAIPPSELSNRSMKNNKDLHAILHQLSSEERAKDVVISGDPDSLDVMFTYTNPESGRVSKVSARDMNKYANTYVSVKGDLDVLDKVSTSVAAVFNPVVNAYASSDKYIDKNPREELFNQESTDATIRGYLTDEMRATIFEEELAEQTNYQDFDPSNQVHMNLTFDYFKNEVYNKVRDVDNIKTKDTETGPPEQTEKTFLETYRPFVQNLLKKANTLSGGKASRKSQQEYIAKELNVLLGGNFKVTADGNNGMTTLTGANVSFDDTVDSKTTFALRNENSILRMLVKFKGPKEGSKRTEILNSLNL